MSKTKKNDLVMPATWRNLKPSFSRKSNSRIVARKRWAYVARLIFGTSFIIFIFSFLFLQLGKSASTEMGKKDYTGPAMPINQVIFHSSGPLNKEWFLNWLGPLRGSSLVEVDLGKLHQNLLNEEQILSARITRNFPSTLESRNQRAGAHAGFETCETEREGILGLAGFIGRYPVSGGGLQQGNAQA